MKFRDDIIAKVPVECLIEDIQMLRRVLAPDYDMHNLCDDINCIIECLEESLERYTEKKPDMQFVPTGFNVVAMCCQNGIIVNDDGSDIECAGGVPCHKIGTVPNCEECPYMKSGACDPENGKIAFCHDGEIVSFVPKSFNDDSVLDEEAFVDLMFPEESEAEE